MDLLFTFDVNQLAEKAKNLDYALKFWVGQGDNEICDTIFSFALEKHFSIQKNSQIKFLQTLPFKNTNICFPGLEFNIEETSSENALQLLVNILQLSFACNISFASHPQKIVFDKTLGTEIHDILRNNQSNLEILDLSLTETEPWILKLIFNGIKKNNTLSTLKLFDMNLNNIDMFHLLDCLNENKSIHTLKVGCNDLNEISIQHITRLLEVNDRIKHLDLRWSNIDNEKIEIISEGLKLNETLETLNLIGNKIKDNGLHKLLKVLDSKKNFQALHLHQNHISSQIALAIKHMNIKQIFMGTQHGLEC